MGTFFDDASLALIPSGVKDGKVYSIKPTDGSGDFTFSRGTDTATRVNSSGLIEKERSNQLLQSNTFSNVAWSTSNAVAFVGGQSGYDGTNDAWTATPPAATGNSAFYQSNISNLATTSIYAKYNGYHLRIRVGGTGGNRAYATFDLQNGTIGNSGGSAFVDAKIEAVGATGWYRCSMTKNYSTAGLAEFQVSENATDGDNPSWTPNGTSGIYIQDAQLEEGLVAQPYIETTTAAVYEGITDNLPRLDYSGGASCPSLLLEPSRTNLVSLSEYIGGWSGTNMGVVNNDATSPEGVVNAAEIESTSTNASHYIGSPNFSMTSGVDYTGSMFVKAKTARYFQLFFGGVSFTSVGYANFDLQEGVVTAEGSAVTGDIEPYGNDWYRVSISGTSAATGSATLYAAAITSGSAARIEVHNSVLSYNIWGAQCEAGNYVTSIIPTYGTSASRAADSCVKTGISDLIGQTEGTLFVDLDELNDIDVPVVTIDDNTNSNRILFVNQLATGYWGIFTASSGSGSASYGTTTGTSGKFALAYSNTGYSLYRNGVEVASHTASLPSSLSSIRLNGRATNDLYGIKGIKQALLFKTRLTNAELAALTTI
jgi:hypothetical protein